MSDNAPMLQQPQDDSPELSGARPKCATCGKPKRRVKLIVQGDKTKQWAWRNQCGCDPGDLLGFLLASAFRYEGAGTAGTTTEYTWRARDED